MAKSNNESGRIKNINTVWLINEIINGYTHIDRQCIPSSGQYYSKKFISLAESQHQMIGHRFHDLNCAGKMSKLWMLLINAA
jgi:hypothetical protein